MVVAVASKEAAVAMEVAAAVAVAMATGAATTEGMTGELAVTSPHLHKLFQDISPVCTSCCMLYVAHDAPLPALVHPDKELTQFSRHLAEACAFSCSQQLG